MPPKKTYIAPVRIVEDNPASENRYFGFDAYAETLAGLIANKENATPLVIGLHGNSGAGKTTLMKAVGSRLDRGVPDKPKDYRYCKTIWFNAWKHEEKEALLTALVESVFKAMDADGFFSLAKTKMDGLTKRIDKSRIFTSMTQLAAGADISEFFSDMVNKEKLGFYDTFQKFFNDLVWTFLYWRFKLTEEEKPDDKKAALVIFIDDLDRCTRPHIVKVLETIKRFMARTGWVFVLGGSKAMVETALAEKYGLQAARHFMESLIQVGFTLPRIPVADFTPFTEGVGVGETVLKAHLPQLIPVLGHNPRRLKRFMNDMHMVHGLVRSAGVNIGFEKVLTWGLIDHTHPVPAAKIKTHPQNLRVLQKQITKLGARSGDTPVWQLTGEQLREEKVPHALRAHIQNPAFAALVARFDVTPAQFTLIQTCYRAVDPRPEGSLDANGNSTPALAPDPMATLAAGPFLYGEDNATAVIDAPFDIDIYPVTHLQYRRFMESGGYENPTWWSPDGWQWRKRTGIDSPDGWDNALPHHDRHPVAGVSWYEAEAYARWAAKVLPTEQQWERAARGVDGWEYPWGRDFDDRRCNTAATPAGVATPVDRYSNGISPDGCYDMAGNVWEWTASPVDDGPEAYVVKGGSWADPADSARSATRKGLRPELRHPSLGFRCVREQSSHNP